METEHTTPQPRLVNGFIVEATVTRQPESIKASAYLFREGMVPGCQSRVRKCAREEIGKEETQGKNNCRGDEPAEKLIRTKTLDARMSNYYVTQAAPAAAHTCFSLHVCPACYFTYNDWLVSGYVQEWLTRIRSSVWISQPVFPLQNVLWRGKQPDGAAATTGRHRI